MLIVIPTYNERENIEPLVRDLLNKIPDVTICVVDDDSPDGTGDLCDEMAEANDQFHIIHRKVRDGIGGATLQGIRFALEADHQWIATMDGDGSHDPDHLRRVLPRLSPSNASVFVGSRYCSGGMIDDWPLHRRILSRAVNTVSRVILRVPVSDYSGAFRVYHRKALESIDLDSIRSMGYAYLEEILLKLHRNGVTFEEFPICFKDRQRGQSKASLGQSVRAIADLGRLFALRR